MVHPQTLQNGTNETTLFGDWWGILQVGRPWYSVWLGSQTMTKIELLMGTPG